MPRYYFHLFDHEAFIDTEGMELAGLAEARHQAMRIAGQMIGCNEVRSELTIYVVDQHSKIVMTLRFAAQGE